MKSADQAVEAAKEGAEFVSCPSKDVARQAAEKAGGGKPPIHEIDETTGQAHYHTADWDNTHFLYSVGAAGAIASSQDFQSPSPTRFFSKALTLSSYAEQGSDYEKDASAVLDLINPLSILQDVIDIYDIVTDTEAPNISVGYW